MKIAIFKENPQAILPHYSTPDSAGADIYVLLDEEKERVILPGETYLCHTGLRMAIPSGYVGLIYARSGLATKQGLAPANKVGVVDADYRGEVMVALHNHSAEPRTIHHGDRIAQLVIAPVVQGEFEECSTLPDTTRGAGGFGSTGI